ncbi:MAG: DUF6702 family protein [Panacibacter sp.]
MANILFQWLVTAYVGLVHPFFVSMTDINYNDHTKSLEISVRIFTDDLENALRKYHTGKIDILHPADKDQMNAYVNEYIQQHLQLKINDKTAELSFVGYEEQSESIWSYLEVKNIDKVNNVNIVNSLLHDYNTNQINMMHIKVKDNEQSDKLNYPATTALFKF